MPSESDGYGPSYHPDDLLDVASRTIKKINKLESENSNYQRIIEELQKENKSLKKPHIIVCGDALERYLEYISEYINKFPCFLNRFPSDWIRKKRK